MTRKKPRHTTAAIVGWILLLYSLVLISILPFSFHEEGLSPSLSLIALFLMLPVAIVLVSSTLRRKLDISLYPWRKEKSAEVDDVVPPQLKDRGIMTRKESRNIAAAVVGWFLLLLCLGLIFMPPYSYRNEGWKILIMLKASLLLLPVAIVLVSSKLRRILDINLFPRRKTD